MFTNKWFKEDNIKVEKSDCSSESSDDDSFSQGIVNIPFKHNEFKLKSTWNPPGPKILEDFIFLNEECLRKHKVFAPQNRNLSSDEYKAIKELSSNTSIVIKPADKGGAVVIQDRSDYLNEGYSQLKDSNVYEKLDQCKTDEFHNIICKFLEYTYKFDREISKETYEYLTQFKPRTSRLYLLPKIHKQKRPHLVGQSYRQMVPLPKELVLLWTFSLNLLFAKQSLILRIQITSLIS